MIPELPVVEEPDWLKSIDSKNIGEIRFPLKEILSDSLYYPASGFDALPIKKLGGNVFSFIYVDYLRSRERLDEKLKDPGFKGYHVMARRDVTKQELAPRGWSPQPPPGFRGYDKGIKERFPEPFAVWTIMERKAEFLPDHGPDRFSFLFICADGAAAFQALYTANGRCPKYVAVIQPGDAFGGNNYESYRNPRSNFARSVINNPAGIPGFLLFGGYGDRDGCGYDKSCWPQYPTFITHYDRREGYAGIWARQ